MDEQVIIYCGMHGLYEKADHNGYTADPRRAGIYERSKVECLVGSPYSDRKNELLPVPEDHETRIAERLAALRTERDALAEQNARLRAALEEVHEKADDWHSSVEWEGREYTGAVIEVIDRALSLTPPAALEELRRRERSIGAEEELRRLAGEVQATTRFTEDGLMHGQIDAEDLKQRADAIRDEREKGARSEGGRHA